MTLNDLERRNSVYFAFFSPNSTDFQADYITVVEDRPGCKILSPIVPVFYFWQQDAQLSQRDRAAGCIIHCEAKKLHRFIFAIALSELHLL